MKKAFWVMFTLLFIPVLGMSFAAEPDLNLVEFQKILKEIDLTADSETYIDICQTKVLSLSPKELSNIVLKAEGLIPARAAVMIKLLRMRKEFTDVKAVNNGMFVSYKTPNSSEEPYILMDLGQIRSVDNLR